MAKYVILPPLDDMRREFARRLADTVPELNVVATETDEEAVQELKDADGAYGWVPPEALAAATKLKLLQNPDAGPFHGYYYRELVDSPIVISNPRGIYFDHISHHIMMFMLALSRGLPDWVNAQKQSRWDIDARKHRYINLPDSTVLINGVGGIGAETARLCSEFGARVIGIEPRSEIDSPAELHEPNELDALLPEADFVVTTVPHTPDTEFMWNADRFKLMKNTAYFINIGRGMTTKIDDLADAIEAGEIAGAGLDVFEIEPLPADHRLWTMDNVLITPHVAVSDAENIPERRFEIILENVKRMLDGREFINIVDKEKWY
ncbi:MAG TPA: D-2-hydroxyacid dehydrogenase [Dehalococcoidia bacterium]|nr:D-2-hydroxyacid dehydrogenase [Dehalococcoidia bacterium]HJM53449.1 D-2-hydroxyacid dehydrogenase [Dehalococcoidia bacterium]